MDKTTFTMNTYVKLFFFLGVLFFSLHISAQDNGFVRQEFIPDGPICRLPPGEYTGLTSSLRNEEVLEKISRGGTPCSNFVVNYTGFTPEAQTAFQFAVDIWAFSIESSVDIIINANFEDLGGNTLGAAGPLGYFTVDTNIAPEAMPNTWYPKALVEKLEGSDTDIFGLQTPDISASFSSTFNFYFGLDANPPANQIDFVTVVLHEIGHGLGFTSRRSSDGTTGTIVNGTTRNTIYDEYVENGAGASILSFTDPSTDLHDEFTSGDLFCNSPIAVGQNAGIKPEFYAPASYAGGSSYAHWDEFIYPAGNPNALMTPSAAPGEGNHNIGNITLGFFEDMGWSICGGSLSVDEFKVTDIDISPNPFTSSVSIRLINGFNDDYKVDLIDINGRVILTENKAANNDTITLSNLDQLEDALYFIKITNDYTGATITKRVIKN